MSRRSNQQCGLWDYFFHLPLKHSQVKKNGTHKKAWCRYCLMHWIRNNPFVESLDVSMVPRQFLFDDARVAIDFDGYPEFRDIPLQHFLRALEEVSYISGKIDSMFAHLRDTDNDGCRYISENERMVVVAQFGVKRNGTVRPGIPTLAITNPSPLPGPALSQNPAGSFTVYPASPLQHRSTFPGGSNSLSLFPPPPPSLSPSPSPSPSLSPLLAFPSNTGPLLFTQTGSTRLAKRARTVSSGTSSSAGFQQSSQLPWTADRQADLNVDICRLFASAGYAWNSAGNAEWALFAQKWVDLQACMPDRRTLSGPVLSNEVARVEHAIALRVCKKLAMFQCDGWKNIAKNPILGSLMTVEGEVILISTRNLSGLPKTGDQLLEIVKEIDADVSKRFGVVKIGHCTDDGPDGKKMRRLASKIWPDRVFILCWAHQNECIVKDVMKASTVFRDALSLAIDIVKYINNHDIVKCKFREQTCLQFKGQWWSLSLPGDTRWTSWYLVSACFVKLKGPMQFTFLESGNDFASHIGQNDTHAGVQRIVAAVLDPQLYTCIEGIRDILEPFAIATHILQAPYARLDHVLTTLGCLYHVNLQPSWYSRGLNALSERALSSLATRFAKAEQELFIYATFANPKIRGDIFSGGAINMQTLFSIAYHLSSRFYGDMDQKTLLNFTAAFDSYYHRMGVFEDGPMGMNLAVVQKMYMRAQGKDVDLVKIWQRHLLSGDDYENIHHGCNRFVMLAIRILSIIPNSASCERQFSAFGRTHTKLRNQLGEQSVHKVSVLNSELSRRHEELGLGSGARKPMHHGVYVPSTLSQTLSARTPSLSKAQPLANPEQDEPEEDNYLEGIDTDVIDYLDSHMVESADVEVSDADVFSLCQRLGLAVPTSRPVSMPKYKFTDLFNFNNAKTISLLNYYWVPNYAFITGQLDQSAFTL